MHLIPEEPNQIIDESEKNSIPIITYESSLSDYATEEVSNKELEEQIERLSLILEKNIFEKPTHVLSAENLVLRKCGQSESVPFANIYPDTILQNCHKIGEGVYGEVFLYQKDKSSSVIKIIPVEGSQTVNGEKQKKFNEILSEIVITKELSDLRYSLSNYTSLYAELTKVSLVKGRYPERLIDLWDLYDENKSSENDSPEMFEDDQLYVILELANAGRDAESFLFRNAMQALSMVKQVAFALAVAEQEFKFEHRDLHWGNILLKTCKERHVKFSINGWHYKVNTLGIQATIIDFTLSRIECEGVVIFNDLSSDDELFAGAGDYQFDVYRLMQKTNGNDWQHFEPCSNILWLHYLLDKCLKGLRYIEEKGKQHVEGIKIMKALKNEVLSFTSALEFATKKLTRL